ncbi:MAG: tetraacyldisaccharide 4'-kinase [Pelagibacterales bacterium]|nr:tetraacyldisaccharide 4'-kinase [Pelagibacterales bacterium]
MLIKTPKFWAKRNYISFVLLPFSILYYLVLKIRNLTIKPCKISKPVICIGNFIAGGAGKTPVAMAIGKLLQQIISESEKPNYKFAYLSSGYKGKSLAFEEVDRRIHTSKEVGDEPLLLSEISKTFVAKNRLFGAKKIDLIEELKTIILDDGMQNNSLKKDLTIAVVDGNIGFGNGFMIPAGPMRQDFETDYKKVDFVVVVGKPKEDLLQKFVNKKVVFAELIANNLESFADMKVIAFCGLAYPDKFFSFLEKQSVNVVQKISFPDHYDYKNSDLLELIKIAESKNAKLITTKKDWIKFSQDFKERISYLDVELKFIDEGFVSQELKRIIKL